MEFQRFVQGIDRLYSKIDELNTDAMQGRFHIYFKDISLNEVKEALLSFAKKSTGNRKDLDKIIILQWKYRRLFGWDENVYSIIDAAGYLGQRYVDISDYIFDQIILENNSDDDFEEDEIESESESDKKYVLVHCLTAFAKINPRSTSLLWRLHWCSWGTNWIWNSGTADEEKQFIELDKDVHQGLHEARKVFDIASPEVINFLISQMTNSESIPPMMFVLLNQVLGDVPLVKCQIIGEDGNYSNITHDFSDQVISLIRNSNLLGQIDDLFARWCKNDINFRQKTSNAIDDTDTEISYLIYFLKDKLKEAKRKTEGTKQIEQELKSMTEERKRELNLDSIDIEIYQDEIKHLPEDIKRAGFLELTLERLRNEETKAETFRMCKDAMYKNQFDRVSFWGEAYDYINFRRFTFRQRTLN